MFGMQVLGGSTLLLDERTETCVVIMSNALPTEEEDMDPIRHLLGMAVAAARPAEQ